MEHIHRRQIHQLKYVPKLELACGGQRWRLNIPRSYRDIRKLITNVCRQKKETQKQKKEGMRRRAHSIETRNGKWMRMRKCRKTGENTKKMWKFSCCSLSRSLTLFDFLRLYIMIFFFCTLHPFEYAYMRWWVEYSKRTQKDSQNENVFIIIPTCLDIKWNICEKNKKKNVCNTVANEDESWNAWGLS